MEDLGFFPAARLADMIRRRELGCRELLEHFLARVERLNPRLNAVVTLDPMRARAQADALDRELRQGKIRSALHGLPITVKDTFETEGMRTTAGAELYSTHVPATNALAVQRLIDAGAVVFGKTNTPAFAADVQTYNSMFGTTHNPWDVSRTPGGSSGGAAAAVAAGLTAFELGSDIGGSIRTPAHYCGIYGHKPSYGIVPMRGHIPGPPGTLSEGDIAVAGPLARSAEDLQLILDVIAGPSADERTGWSLSLPAPRHNRLSEFRVGAWLDDADYPVDSGVIDVLENLVSALGRAGVKVDDKARPAFSLSKAFRAYLRLLWPVMMAGLSDAEFERHARAARDPAPDDESYRALMDRLGTASHRDWLKANESRMHYRAKMREFFQAYDVLLSPVTPITAFAHDQSADTLNRTISINGQARWYWEQLVWVGAIAGMNYLPATVAPAGRARGLPVGVQIIGPYLEDRTTIEFARELANVGGEFTAPA